MFRKKKKFNAMYLIIFFPLAILLSYLATFSPTAVEKYYAASIYRAIAQILSSITGVLPFSLAEIFVITAVLATITGIIYGVRRIARSPRKRLKVLLKQLSSIAIAVSLVYFSFISVWGLNYHRLPFATIANMDVSPSSVEELEALCKGLINQANYLRDYVQEDNDGVMYLPNGVKDVFKRANFGYQAAADTYPELGGRYGRPKGVMLSKLMSYGGIWGVYFPFTAEANVNVSIPHSVIPSTTTHEMAHQRGFAREDEANFIAYITSIMHPDYDFQYSGALLALLHSMNALAGKDFEKFAALREQYSPGVARDFNAINRHSDQHDGIISKVSSNINDAYLKVNAQNDGVQSYGRMVDLLLAHYRESLTN